MIKVVHIQTHLPSSGNAAFRLHSNMNKIGLYSTMLSLTSDLPDSQQISSLRFRSSLKAMLNNPLSNKLKKGLLPEFGMFSYPIVGNDLTKHEFVEEADVIYVHWAIGGLLNFKSIERLAKLNKPIIFFVHDMWYLTGGCHYSFDCTNYESNCDDCQMFSTKKLINISKIGFKRKLELFKKFNNVNFVTPSKWLFDLAHKSRLTKNKPIYYIPNVVDSDNFKVLNQNFSRKIFDLNEDEKIIVFGAASPKSPYKGWPYLMKALNFLNENSELELNKIVVVIFGCEFDEQIEQSIPFKTKFVGRLRDEKSLSLLYNAADVFVAPSMAEAFGLVILESLRCGTPVAAFNTGGVPDIIDHKKNGYLAKYKDSEDLAAGIDYLLNSNVKAYAAEKFDAELISKTHRNLINRLFVQ